MRGLCPHIKLSVPLHTCTHVPCVVIFFFVTSDAPAGGDLALLHCNGLFLNWRLEECGACGVGEFWSLCELHLYIFLFSFLFCFRVSSLAIFILFTLYLKVYFVYIVF